VGGAYLVSVGQHDRVAEQTGLGYPVRARHFTSTVENVAACKGVIFPDNAFTREDDSRSSAGDARLVVIQRGMTYPYARHIRDGIMVPCGVAANGYTKFSKAGA
jgi:hypothetical protein